MEECKEIGEIIRCSIWLEELTVMLYEKLSEKTQEPYISSLLLLIAKQSKSHAEALRSLRSLLGFRYEDRTDLSDCAKLIGEPAKSTMNLIKELDKIEIITGENYGEIVKKLEFIEGAVGEETYTKLLIPALKNIILECSTIDRKNKELLDSLWELYKMILDIIVEEEKLHEEIVKTIYNIYR